MQTRTVAEQGTLAGAPVPVRRNVFTTPIDELRRMVEDSQVECQECGAFGRVGRRMAAVEVYDSPWQVEPTIIYACVNPSSEYHGGAMDVIGRFGACVDLLTDTSWADFRYFTCEWCERMVISQCPSNGYHSYVRIVNECEQVCLKCYEERMFDEGLPREDFEAGKIPGMFCDRSELEKHGFETVDGFETARIASTEDADRFCARAMALIDTGHVVAVDYESMGIGGSEGYVSLYAKATGGYAPSALAYSA